MTRFCNAQSTSLCRSQAKRSVLLGGVVLVLGVLGASAAQAQCRDNFNFAAVINGQLLPVQTLLPLGVGSSLSALTSTINTVNTAFLTSTSAFVSAPSGPQPDQQGGGAWGRVIAGTVDSKTSSTGTLDVSAAVPAQPPATGTQTCNTTTRQDYAGFQVGHDFSILNHGGSGANWHWGITAGYVEARTTDITGAGSFTNPNFPPGFIAGFSGTFVTPAGSFNETSQVPFAGLYTAYTKQNFFADAQLRWDFYQNSISDRNNGLFDQRLDARGISVTGNVGYNIPLHNNWFLEPSGGVVWSRVHIDPLSVPGLVAGGAAFARGTVTVDDIESVLGRATLRVGTTFSTGQVTWQPYATASVFHEFAGDVTARSLEVTGAGSPINGISLTTTSKGGVGTYGQFALGSAAVLGNSGWLGYARVDYRVGDVIEGIGVNAGMRYQFSPERRASIKDGPTPTAWDTYNWTGLYAGVYAGANWGGEDWLTSVILTRDKPDFAGYLLGGQVGYNHQVGRIVVGIEGDYGLSNSKGGKACSGGATQFFLTCQAEIDQLGAVTGRLGYTWGRALFYGKGGVAFGEVTAQTSQNQGTAVPPSFTPVNGETKWLTGWTLGGGMEFALAERWSAKAEYMHYDLGKANYAIDSGLVASTETKGDNVRIGVNYHLHRAEPTPIK